MSYCNKKVLILVRWCT